MDVLTVSPVCLDQLHCLSHLARGPRVFLSSGESEEPIGLPPVIVNIHCPFNKMEEHLGDSPLNTCERDFLLYHNEGRKAHRECG